MNPIPPEFSNRILEDKAGCWIWTGALSASGNPTSSVCKPLWEIYKFLYGPGSIDFSKLVVMTCSKHPLCVAKHSLRQMNRSELRDFRNIELARTGESAVVRRRR